MKRKKASEIIIELIRERGFKLSKKVRFMRQYSGYWQKASGACSWVVIDMETMSEFLGDIPLKELLKCPDIQIGKGRVDCGCKGFCKGVKG